MGILKQMKDQILNWMRNSKSKILKLENLKNTKSIYKRIKRIIGILIV